MKMVFKYWLCYYAFVKKSKKKWPDNSSIEPVAIALLFFNLLNISIVLESVFGFQGVSYFMSRGIPLAPFGFVGGAILMTILYLAFSKYRGKREFIRYAVEKTRKVKYIYVKLYLIITGLAFFASIFFS